MLAGSTATRLQVLDAASDQLSPAPPPPAGAAAAACTVEEELTENDDGNFEENVLYNGCLQCMADGSRCEECAERWVLTAAGQCAKVSGAPPLPVSGRRALRRQQGARPDRPAPACSAPCQRPVRGMVRAQSARPTTHPFVLR